MAGLLTTVLCHGRRERYSVHAFCGQVLASLANGHVDSIKGAAAVLLISGKMLETPVGLSSRTYPKSRVHVSCVSTLNVRRLYAVDEVVRYRTADVVEELIYSVYWHVLSS